MTSAQPSAPALPGPRIAAGLLALLGVFLSLPTLDMGLRIDDYHHRAAIAEGIAQMEAGEGRPAEEAFEDMRSRLGFPPEE